MSQAGKPTGLMGILFGWIMHRSNRRMNQAIADELELTGDESLLEIGCGTGDALVLLAPRLPDGCIVGIDHSEVMVKRAIKTNRRFNNVTIELSGLEYFSAKSEAFNYVLLSNVHQFWLDPIACFSEINTLLKPEGVLTVAIRLHDTENRSFFSKIGYNQEKQDELFEQLKQAGFTNIKKTRINLQQLEVMLVQASVNSDRHPL